MKLVKWFIQISFQLVLLSGLYVYGMFQGGFVSWFLFYSYLPLALYLLMFSLFPIRFLNLKWKVKKDQLTAGEDLKISVSITRKLPLPLLHFMITLVPSKGIAKSVVPIKAFKFVGFRRTVTESFTIPSLNRGEYEIGEIKIKTSDFFGLIQKETVKTIDGKVLVYPQYKILSLRDKQNHYEQGNANSKLTHQFDTTMAIGIREYLPGDKFSWIDWKATARKSKMITKEFEQQRSHDVVILMDGMVNKKEVNLLFEKKVMVAASLVKSILKQETRLGFVTQGKERVAYPLMNGKLQEKRIFAHLARVEADGQLPFSSILEEEGSKWPKGVSFILITTQLKSSLLDAAKRLVRGQRPTSIYLITPSKELSKEVMQRILILEQHKIKVSVITPAPVSKGLFEVKR